MSPASSAPLVGRISHDSIPLCTLNPFPARHKISTRCAESSSKETPSSTRPIRAMVGASGGVREGCRRVTSAFSCRRLWGFRTEGVPGLRAPSLQPADKAESLFSALSWEVPPSAQPGLLQGSNQGSGLRAWRLASLIRVRSRDSGSGFRDQAEWRRRTRSRGVSSSENAQRRRSEADEMWPDREPARRDWPRDSRKAAPCRDSWGGALGEGSSYQVANRLPVDGKKLSKFLKAVDPARRQAPLSEKKLKQKAREEAKPDLETADVKGSGHGGRGPASPAPGGMPELHVSGALPKNSTSAAREPVPRSARGTRPGQADVPFYQRKMRKDNERKGEHAREKPRDLEPTKALSKGSGRDSLQSRTPFEGGEGRAEARVEPGVTDRVQGRVQEQPRGEGKDGAVSERRGRGEFQGARGPCGGNGVGKGTNSTSRASPGSGSRAGGRVQVTISPREEIGQNSLPDVQLNSLCFERVHRPVSKKNHVRVRALRGPNLTRSETGPGRGDSEPTLDAAGSPLASEAARPVPKTLGPLPSSDLRLVGTEAGGIRRRAEPHTTGQVSDHFRRHEANGVVFQLPLPLPKSSGERGVGATSKEDLEKVASQAPARQLSGEVASEPPARQLSGEVASQAPARQLSGEVASQAPARQLSGEVASEPPARQLSGEVAPEATPQQALVEVAPEAPARQLSGEVASEPLARQVAPEIGGPATVSRAAEPIAEGATSLQMPPVLGEHSTATKGLAVAPAPKAKAARPTPVKKATNERPAGKRKAQGGGSGGEGAVSERRVKARRALSAEGALEHKAEETGSSRERVSETGEGEAAAGKGELGEGGNGGGAVDRELSGQLAAEERPPQGVSKPNMSRVKMEAEEDRTGARVDAEPRRQSSSGKEAGSGLGSPHEAEVQPLTPVAVGGVEPAATGQRKRPPLTGEAFVEGIVHRIRFTNPDNGYTVAVVRPTGGSPIPKSVLRKGAQGAEALAGQGGGTAGKRRRLRRKGGGKEGSEAEDSVTVVGLLGGVSAGQPVRFLGTWRYGAKYGMEFEASGAEEITPEGTQDIERYLGGGVIKGVGPKTATLMVAKYGEGILGVLDSPQAAKLLCKVDGIGVKKAAAIAKEWDTRRWERAAMAFLQTHEVSTAAAQRLVRRHGTNAEAEVKTDPWCATEGLVGWDFEVTDNFARAIGADPTLPSRNRAALSHVLLSQCMAEGHSYLPWGSLARLAGQQLAVRDWAEEPPLEDLERTVWDLVDRRLVTVEEGEEDRRDWDRDAEREGAGGGFVEQDEGKRGEVGDGGEGKAGTAVGGPEGRGEGPRGEGMGAGVMGRSCGNEGEARLGRRISPWARCYSASLYEAECQVAADLRARASRKIRYRDPARVGKWIRAAEAQTAKQLSGEQRRAVEAAAFASVFVLTGGPGCGKTHTTRTIVKLWNAMGKSVLLCAPTGRAAQKLAETAGQEARTIHRLLEYCPKDGPSPSGGTESQTGTGKEVEAKDVGVVEEVLSWSAFQRNATNQLEVQALVVDEASMLDLPLAAALLAAVPRDAQLLFVGDVDQLPPVGPGNVLRDVIRSNQVQVHRLTEVFRQAQRSAIVTNAHAVNRGQFPDLEKRLRVGGGEDDGNWWDSLSTDCVWVEARDFKDGASYPIMDSIREAVEMAIPALGFNARSDVQVLSPVHKGPLGTFAFNKMLQEALNPPHPSKGELPRGMVTYREGDRVIQLRNDYEKEIYNGDLGTICAIDRANKEVEVEFAPTGADIARRVKISGMDLDHLGIAWAITVHKSQGSEYPVVLLPLSSAYGRILSRKLLYTGLSRAQKLAIVFGSRKAIQDAIGVVRDDARFTHLHHRLAAPGANATQPDSQALGNKAQHSRGSYEVAMAAA